MRHSNRTRRGRALFVFTVGIVLIVLASAFFLLRAVGTTQFVGVGAAATLLGCAMLVVAAGSLLPSVEDWFGARRELRTIQPLLDELGRRHPDVGIGVRPRGPLVFRVAERMSLISDALFLEATAAEAARRRPVDAAGAASSIDLERARARRPVRRRGPDRGAGGAGARHRGVDLRRPRRIGRGSQSVPRSPVWGGCVSRRPIRTGSGSWPSRSSTDSWTGRGRSCPDRTSDDYFAGCRVAAAPRANRRGAPCDATRRPSERCPVAPLRIGRPSVPQYGGRPRHAYWRATSIPCPASRSTRRR